MSPRAARPALHSLPPFQPGGQPNRLFKFMERKWALRMAQLGEVRVGTLYGFRDVEKHGPEIGDAHEGTSSVGAGVELLSSGQTPSSPIVQRHMQQMFGAVSPPPGITFQDCVFGESEHAPNSYIFCASERLDVDAMKEMGYDAVMLIRDPVEYANAVGRALLRKGVPVRGRVRLAPVQYAGRWREEGTAPVCPTEFLKDQRYEHQREWRAVYVPAVGGEPAATDFQIVADRAITRWCELVKPEHYHRWQTPEQQARFDPSAIK